MGRFLIVMVIGGAALLFVGVQELRLVGIARPEPTWITCEALGEAGPGDNAHVVMSDFILSPSGFVFEAGEQEGGYKTVLIPALPRGGEYHRQISDLMIAADGLPQEPPPPPRQVRVVIKSAHLRNDDQIATVGNTIQGVVINPIEKLSGQELSLLQDSYPGIDFTSVWVLEHRRKPAGRGKTIALVGGGAALLLLAAVGFVVQRVRRRA